MANSSSSSAEEMPRQTTNEETQARYAMVAAKSRWEEQGFFLDESLVNYGLEPIIYRRLSELGWFRFAQQPARANLNWVLEFYTNNAGGEDNTTVRGRRVAANSATINEILSLSNDDPSIYALLRGLEDEDYETIKDFLCEPGTEWNTTGRNPHSVSRLRLQPEAKLWNTFVKRNLMPTSHNQTVDRTRLVLINVIMTGYRFNVGEVIAQEIAAACQNNKGILAFPCIITAFCRRAAVQTLPGDKYTAEKPDWSRKEYMRKMDVADTTPIRIALPTPSTSPAHTPTPAQQTPTADPSDGAGNTEQLHLSEEDIFDWHTPMEHQSQLNTADVPGSSKANDDAPAPAEPPTAVEDTLRRRGKATAKRIIQSDRSSSPDQPEQQPAKRQRRYHIVTTDSDDEGSAGLSAADPELSADQSFSKSF
ncbi:hypothetical protein V6N11_060615 [Hibiscus sabdariffa]|uniref:Putative plant transposon protein domain-containing protein n=1 Tax=Hibiscus sabdariffa TaxID=183260 RepID=A0ABR2QQU9_9ROSI